MRQRVLEARVARLATASPDGRPHPVPFTFVVADDVLYSVVDDVKPKTTRDLRRLDNVRRNPAVSVLVDHYAEQWSELWWIRLDATAQVVDASSALHATGTALLRAKYPQYLDASLDGPMITMTIDRWTAWP